MSKALQNVDKLNNIVNVRDFGAKGDGVTDDAAAFQAAINFAQAANFSQGRAQIRIPATTASYIIGSELVVSGSVDILGDGQHATLLDSRTSSGWLFNCSGGPVTIGRFAMLHGVTGGIYLNNAARSKVYDIWTGVGSRGGISFYNRGSLLCVYENCLATTDGFQHVNDYANVPDYGFKLESVSGPQVPNMTVLKNCGAAGMRLGGLWIDNTAPGNIGQAYVKLYGCDFEGNLTFDIKLVKVFGAEFFGCHTEGIAPTYNVIVDNCEKVSFFGGIISKLNVIGNSVNTTFDGCYFSKIIEADTVLSTYRNCTFDSNGLFRFSNYAEVTNSTLQNNYSSVISQRIIADRTRESPTVLTSNGDFAKWITASQPAEWEAHDGAILARTTTRDSGIFACQITAVGTSQRQGLSFVGYKALTSKDLWISVAGKVRVPAGQNKGIKIVCDIGFDIIATVPYSQLTDDTFTFFSAAFNVGNNNWRITIVPSSNVANGDNCIVDNVTISEGIVPPTYATARQKSISLGTSETSYQSLESGTAEPTTGAYNVGDIVFNSAPSAGGFIGWVCVGAGSPGTWKTFGAISA